MSEYQQLLLLSEFDAVWPGTPRPLDELLPSSVLIEVESLSELRMQIHVVEDELDFNDEGDLDAFLYQDFPLFLDSTHGS